MAKRYVDKRGRRVSTRIIAYTSSFAVAIAPSLPAFAQVVASGDTATTITPAAPGTTNITTGTISAAGIAYNEFSQFNIPQDQTVNLYQPDSTKALVNVVDNIHGLPSRIDGTLNAPKGSPGSASSVGSNVFIVDANGFVVGSLAINTSRRSDGSALVTIAVTPRLNRIRPQSIVDHRSS